MHLISFNKKKKDAYNSLLINRCPKETIPSQARFEDKIIPAGGLQNYMDATYDSEVPVLVLIVVGVDVCSSFCHDFCIFAFLCGSFSSLTFTLWHTLQSKKLWAGPSKDPAKNLLDSGKTRRVCPVH